MSFTVTYASLQQMMKDWPANQGDNYVADLPQMIGMGELRLTVDLNLDIFDQVDRSETIATGARFIVKPAGLLQLRAMRLALITSTSFTAADPQALCLSQATTFDVGPLMINGTLQPAPVTLNPPAQITVTQTAGVADGIIITIQGTNSFGDPAVEVIDTIASSTVTGTTRFATVTSITSQRGSISSPTLSVKVGKAAVTATVLGESYPVVKRSKDFCDAYNNDPAVVGRPKYFNEYSFSEWEVVQSADQSYGVILHYIIRPESIVDAGSTWLGTNCGELLFLASLLEAERYLKADDRFDDIHQDYQEKLATRRMELRDSIRRGDYTPVAPAATKAQ